MNRQEASSHWRRGGRCEAPNRDRDGNTYTNTGDEQPPARSFEQSKAEARRVKIEIELYI